MRAIFIIALNLLFIGPLFAKARGIYISQHTLESTSRLKSLIKEAKAVRINTFVIDLKAPRQQYDRNIKYVLDAGLKYVVRIVVFPGGGNRSQVHSMKIRQEKLKLIKKAIALGAKEVQLDYIRYNVRTPSSRKNAEDIRDVITWFKKRTSVPLQIAVFGVSAHRPSNTIGQNLVLFSPHVSVIAPMLYPSHYEPKSVHSYQPYRTVKGSLDALSMQFNGSVPNRVITYIETSNYRRSMNTATRMDYIKEQIRAVDDAGFDGWYFWSAKNHYSTLFQALR